MTDPRLRLLLYRWASWRIGLQPPPRAAVNPAEIKPCLPDLWIFRITDSGDDMVCTLAGEGLREAWGFSIIGSRPVDLWGKESGGIARDRLLVSARAPAVIHGRTDITPRSGPAKLAQRLMLPLADDAGAPYGVMGMTLFAYDRHLDQDLPVALPLHTSAYPCASLPAELPLP